MDVALAIPHLIALGDRAGAADVRAPGLTALLAAAGAPRRDDAGLDAVIAARFGVTRQSDWPLAPIRLAACGVEPGPAFWFCVDPVTLVVGRDDVTLGGIVGDLDADAAAALTRTLNAHFADDGLRFVAPRPDRLFARVDPAPRLVTHPPAPAIGAGLRPLQPSGADAARWQRWQSEIQMLLHEHPVNVSREAAGRAPVNSLWFSCGGTLPRLSADAAPATFADGGIAPALAALAGKPARALPPRLVDALALAQGAARALVAVPPDLPLAALEERWAAPAFAQLVAAKIGAVTLLAEGAGAALEWHALRPRLWARITGRRHRGDLAAMLGGGRPER